MWAERNYSQVLGSGIYSIADAGCFLVAFANLLERYGREVDPPTLNNYFIQHDSYMHDPSEPAGTKDNLAWGSVTAYDSSITVAGVGGAGWPDSSDAIVEFHYRSLSHPTLSNGQANMVNHFCLVVDAGQGVILDSWDGVVKKSPYGNPVAWAKYHHNVPQVVTPPPPAEAPSYTIEVIGSVNKRLKLDTHLWDLNQRSWPGMVNNPVKISPSCMEFTTNAIAHHLLGGSYYMPDATLAQGYNIVDCEDIPSVRIAAPVEQEAPPAPEEPTLPKAPFTTNTIDRIKYEALGASKRMYVSKPGGCEKWDFKNVQTWRDFKSVGHVDLATEVYIVGIAHHPIPPSGADYYMVAADWGNFASEGNVTNEYGFNWSDLSENKPVIPEVKAAETVSPVAEVIADKLAEPETVDWQSSYKPLATPPTRYVALKDYLVLDLGGVGFPKRINIYDHVIIAGTVVKDSQTYYVPQASVDKGQWYGIPATGNYLESEGALYSTVTTPASRKATKTSKPRDYLIYGLDEAGRVIATMERVWDVLPFKRKNIKK